MNEKASERKVSATITVLQTGMKHTLSSTTIQCSSMNVVIKSGAFLVDPDQPRGDVKKKKK